MARARNIKPGFYRDAELIELPFETRLLFPGLWLLADREGRLEDRHKQIKMEIFPADSLDVDAMLQQLHESGLICRYQVGEKKYIQVINFLKHQLPHHREPPSQIPAMPCDSRAGPSQAHDQPRASPSLAVLNPDGADGAESRILNPDSSGVDNPTGVAREPQPPDRDEDPPPPASSNPIQSRAIELTAMLRKRGAALQASDPRVLGWAERGITDAAALSALEVAQSRRAEAADPTPVNAGYLDGILGNGGKGNGAGRRATAGERRAATIASLTGRDRCDDEAARPIDGTAKRVG